MCWWRPVYLRSACLSAEEVRQASSDLTVDDVAPSHINRLVAVLADQQERGNPRLATADDLWQVWRTWQRGERRWREPAYEPVAGRETAIRQGAHYGFGWALSRQASRTSILHAQPVDSPLCSCATYATASCALIAPGHAELAALSRLALALLGAGLVLVSGTLVQTMDKDGLGSGPQALGGEGPQAVSVRVAQWRAAHGVRLDEDFAFAFCSLEEATRDPLHGRVRQQGRGPGEGGHHHGHD